MTRRDQQQLLVAELGRAALTGATVAQLVESAVETVAEGLSAEAVALFSQRGESLVATAMVRERAEARLRFLAEAGHLLNESLDYDATLATLADLVVPRLADWCIVDLAEDDGGMRRVAVRAADPRKQELLDLLHREY